MTNNTTHRNCTHPSTKTDRARCRRARAVAQAEAPRVPLTCSCRVPFDGPTCPLCDCPADDMTALGLLLTA